VRPALEIRGLDALQKRFAALGAVKNLGPALRAEAEAVAPMPRAKDCASEIQRAGWHSPSKSWS
jgi:hypothetical protein